MADPVLDTPSDRLLRAEEKASAWRVAVGVLGVAIAAAGFAIAFRLSLNLALEFAGHSTSVVEVMERAPWWVRLLLPAAGGLGAGAIVLLAARKKGGEGVGGVMEAVVLGRVRISMRATLLRSAASWLAIASGGSLGREGPLIQFGGAAGSFAGKKLSLNESWTRILISAGTAAGFAAAYNTPFAAVLFTIEVVTGVIVLEAMVPTLLATVIATALTRAAVGEGPIYGQRLFELHSPYEYLAFVGLGIVVALGAQAFMHLLWLGEKVFRSKHFRLPWRAALGGLIAGGLVALIPEVAGNGYEPLNALLDARYTVAFVAVLLLGKCVATTASVSSGSPGGVFTPSLLVGGGIGFLCAAGLEHLGLLQPGSAGGFALVGMAAATAATTHAPLMAAVMAFELSGDYAIVLPLVLATGVATFVSRIVTRDSIYTAELSRRGIGWERRMEGSLAPTSVKAP